MAAEPDPLLAPTEPETRVPLSIEKVVAAASMAALCLITLGNVVARYLTNYSFAFTEEYSIALMVVVTMLGAEHRDRGRPADPHHLVRRPLAAAGPALAEMLATARDDRDVRAPDRARRQAWSGTSTASR